MREQPAQTDHTIAGHLGGGKAAAAGQIQAPVSQDQLRAGSTHPGLRIHEADHVGQGRGGEDGVRVQQECVTWDLVVPVGHLGLGRNKAGGTQSLVVGLRIAPVLFVGDQVHAGETIPHHVGTAVMGGIVNDPDLEGQVPLAFKDGFQAVAQAIARIVIDDND